MSITIGKVKILKIKFDHSRHFGHVYDFNLVEISDFNLFFVLKIDNRFITRYMMNYFSVIV